MFIDVTRPGGRPLRLAIAAIGYLDECEGGGAIRLIGGESLRVEQAPSEIEQRIAGRQRATAPTAADTLIDTELELAAMNTLESAGLVGPEAAAAARMSTIGRRRRERDEGKDK